LGTFSSKLRFIDGVPGRKSAGIQTPEAVGAAASLVG
jgi:hypothetical protein